MTRVALHGIAGRMGVCLLETAATREDPTVIFGVDANSNVDLAVPVYGPGELESALDTHEPDAMIDFSLPEATVDLVDACAAAEVPLVVGTTGFDEDSLSVLQEASTQIPICKATNFARGIQAMLGALESALDALEGYDVEVLETHHNAKRDAPSGTARTMLETIGDHRDIETVAGREGTHQRESGEVAMLVRRAGDICGEHEVMFADNNEVLTITHRAEDRAVFASGALDAAIWLVEQSPGWYDFEDVIDESTD